MIHWHSEPETRAAIERRPITSSMNLRTRLFAFVACWCAAVLAGCAVPGGRGAASQSFAQLPSLVRPATAANVAGQYEGEVLLKKTVVGKAYFDLTQSGTAVGGTFKLVLSKRTLHEPVAMTLNATNDTLTGNAVDASDKTPCTYALSASYDPKKRLSLVERRRRSPAPARWPTSIPPNDASITPGRARASVGTLTASSSASRRASLTPKLCVAYDALATAPARRE
jgi:hypothetical protein